MRFVVDQVEKKTEESLSSKRLLLAVEVIVVLWNVTPKVRQWKSLSAKGLRKRAVLTVTSVSCERSRA